MGVKYILLTVVEDGQKSIKKTDGVLIPLETARAEVQEAVQDFIDEVFDYLEGTDGSIDDEPI